MRPGFIQISPARGPSAKFVVETLVTLVVIVVVVMMVTFGAPSPPAPVRSGFISSFLMVTKAPANAGGWEAASWRETKNKEKKK